MKIAYRRMSGAVGLTDMETGTRGMWLEKRRALLRELRDRGHDVRVIGRHTKYSQPVVQATWEDGPYDLLMIEFGSSNAKFYGVDLAETKRMVDTHVSVRGEAPVVFICDDPDLPYQWKTVDPNKYGRWRVWMNATKGEPFGGQPASIPIDDAPFASLLSVREPSELATGPLVYIGRPNGRQAAIRAVLEVTRLRVAGREAEWGEFQGDGERRVEVVEPPTQAQRAEFYRQHVACLALADKKHKRMGWRTGRAYHALYAGTPALVEGDHDALRPMFEAYNGTQELREKLQWLQDPKIRLTIWQREAKAATAERSILERTFQASGL